MDLQEYRKNKILLKEKEPKFRDLCTVCIQPDFSCYCSQIVKLDPNIKFVILIHPIEMKRRIATGRMSHLCLKDSELIMGQDYSLDVRVNELIQNSNHQCIMLYPGKNSDNLTNMNIQQRQKLIDPNKKLVVFVIDGTWATARKMVKSSNLISLPRVCFTPTRTSTFRVRKQPAEHCFSTIEAIHHSIELLGPSCGFDLARNQQNNLLHVFDYMVEKQLEFVRLSEQKNGGLSRRHERPRRSA